MGQSNKARPSRPPSTLLTTSCLFEHSLLQLELIITSHASGLLILSLTTVYLTKHINFHTTQRLSQISHALILSPSPISRYLAQLVTVAVQEHRSVFCSVSVITHRDTLSSSACHFLNKLAFLFTSIYLRHHSHQSLLPSTNFHGSNIILPLTPPVVSGHHSSDFISRGLDRHTWGALTPIKTLIISYCLSTA